MATHGPHRSTTERIGARVRSLLDDSWTAAWLLYAAVFLAGTAGIWWWGRTPLWDAYAQFAPTHMLLGDFLSGGRLLLWNPWINGGSPDFADPQLGVFSPISWLFAFLGGGTLAGYLAQWLAIWSCAGVGVLLLARHLGARPWAGMVVAAGLAFSGYYTGHAEHFPQLCTLAWAPLILWRTDVALQRRSWWCAVQAGALWGLSGVAGYPALALGTAMFLGCWALGRAAFPEEVSPEPLAIRLRRALGLLALVGATGLLVLGPNYLSFFREARGFSDRALYLPREVAVASNALPAGAIGSLASPFLSTQQMLGWRDFWRSADVSSASLYLGALIPFLAVVALLPRRRIRFRWWLAAMALASLSFTLGRDLPVRGWAYDFLPFTRFFRHPAFFRFFPMLCLAVLALLGLRDLTRGEEEPGRRPGWLALAFVANAACALALCVYFSLARVGGAPQRLGTAHALLAWAGLAAILWACLRWSSARRWLPASLVLLAVVDAVLTSRISERHTSSADPAERAIWARLAELHDRRLNLAHQGLARGYQRPWSLEVPWYESDVKCAVVKQPILEGTTALNNRLYLDFVEVPALREMAAGPERFYFAPDAPRLAPTHAAYQAWKARAQDPRSPIVFLHSRADMLDVNRYDPQPALDPQAVEAVRGAPPAARIPVEVLRYRPDELQLRVAAAAAGWLVVTDRWARGWEATVDGRPAEILGADFFYRAVHLEPGAHELRMVYRPLGMPWLLVLSWSVLGAVLAGTVAGAVRGRWPRRPAPPRP